MGEKIQFDFQGNPSGFLRATEQARQAVADLEKRVVGVGKAGEKSGQQAATGLRMGLKGLFQGTGMGFLNEFAGAGIAGGAAGFAAGGVGVAIQGLTSVVRQWMARDAERQAKADAAEKTAREERGTATLAGMPASSVRAAYEIARDTGGTREDILSSMRSGRTPEQIRADLSAMAGLGLSERPGLLAGVGALGNAIPGATPRSRVSMAGRMSDGDIKAIGELSAKLGGNISGVLGAIVDESGMISPGAADRVLASLKEAEKRQGETITTQYGGQTLAGAKYPLLAGLSGGALLGASGLEPGMSTNRALDIERRRVSVEREAAGLEGQTYLANKQARDRASQEYQAFSESQRMADTEAARNQQARATMAQMNRPAPVYVTNQPPPAIALPTGMASPPASY